MATKFPLSPSEVSTAIKRCMKHKFVPLLMSSPGMGKSALYHSIAESMNLLVIDIRAAHMDVVEFNGYPDLAGDFATYKPVDLFPTKNSKIPDGYSGWLIFFDELPQADPDVQGAMHKIILDRLLGQHELHEMAFCVAAGNYASDRASSNELITSMQSRVIHLHLRNDLDDFLPYANQNGFSPIVTSFLAFRPALLNNFDPKHNEDTYACQRNWEKLNTLFLNHTDFDQSDMPLLAGTIGAPAASEFLAFAKVWQDMVDLKTIVNNPSTATLPDAPITRYALAGMLSSRITEDTATPIVEYINRFPDELRLVFIRTSFKQNRNLYTNVDYSLLLREFTKELKQYVAI